MYPILRDKPGFLLTWSPPQIAVRHPLGREPIHHVTPPSGYLIEYRPVDMVTSPWKPLAHLPAWQTSFETTDVEPGQLYDFRIMSKGVSDISRKSPSRSSYRRTPLLPDLEPTVTSHPLSSGPHMLPKQIGSSFVSNLRFH